MSHQYDLPDLPPHSGHYDFTDNSWPCGLVTFGRPHEQRQDDHTWTLSSSSLSGALGAQGEPISSTHNQYNVAKPSGEPYNNSVAKSSGELYNNSTAEPSGQPYNEYNAAKPSGERYNDSATEPSYQPYNDPTAKPSGAPYAGSGSSHTAEKQFTAVQPVNLVSFSMLLQFLVSEHLAGLGEFACC